VKRLGPDLKMPNFKRGSVKMPAFLEDLFYDLRERRLLAPLALLVVAILAVPFVLGGGSEEPAPAPDASAVVPPALGTSGAKLTVVEAKPGLRDYRKRLAGRQPTNPFKQHYTSPQVAGAELDEDSSSQTATVTTGGSTGSPSGEAIPTPSTGTPAPAPTSGSTGRLTFFAWGISAWISKAGGGNAKPNGKPESSVKHKVLPQTTLPGRKAPVVTYMGLSRKAAQKDDEARALLLVSDDVTLVTGEAKCMAGGNVCQLIEAQPGVPISFVYGANETRYTIKVLKIELVVTGHS
jgi:hypothetical protein